MAKMNKVCVNLDQSNSDNGGFTDAEKAQARTNIGALGQSDVTTVNRYNWASPTTPIPVEEVKFNQKGVSTSQIMSDNTDLGSTVPLPSLETDEGKVPVAYYRDGRGYYLLEKYKDSRFPDSDSTDVGKVLVVDEHGIANWQTPTVGASNYGVYEFTVTKVLNGTGTSLWSGDGLTNADISETFINCTTSTCPVHLRLDSYGRLSVSLATGYDSITCESHTYVSSNANFATELGMWGYDNLCQVVAGMNRTWYLTRNDILDQNGIRSTTETLKSGTLTIKFDFVFEV